MKVICSLRSLLVLVILLVAGCAATPMNPVAGMSVKELDRMAALSVLGGIKKYGQHPEVPEIDVYETYDQQAQRQRGKTSEMGAGFYYFKDGRLISDDTVKELVEVKRRAIARDNEVKQRIIQARIESERIQREEIRRKEDERRQKEEDERKIVEQKTRVLNEIITKYNLELVYRRGDFAIARTRSQELVFIKDGEIKQRNQVIAELQEYERYVQAQKAAEARRQQNLSYRWVVQANGANPYCRVDRIDDGGRGFQGEAIFNIYYSCTSRLRPGTGGSVGTRRIDCCLGCANTIRGTDINATCQ